MNVIITMAGAGRRFREAGYQRPKYEIEVGGKTLFSWSLSTLRSFRDMSFLFVTLASNDAEAFIKQECGYLGINRFRVVALNALTDGQASTVMHAGEFIRSRNEPILVYNIDTYVDPKALEIPDLETIGGWIPCFSGEGDHWSFVATDKEGYAVELAEKKRISPHATIGLYQFESFVTYEEAYQNYFLQPQNIGTEKYIAPIYNYLLMRGKKILVTDLPAGSVHPLGTPEEVEAFSLNGSL